MWLFIACQQADKSMEDTHQADTADIEDTSSTEETAQPEPQSGPMFG